MISRRPTLSLAAALAAATSLFAAPALALPNVTSPVTGLAGKCLDVPNGATANGTRVQLWDCNGSSAQQWSFQADGSIRAFNKCLDVSNSGTADGSVIQLWDCNGSGAQQWLQVGDPN